MKFLRYCIVYAIVLLTLQPVCNGHAETSQITTIHQAPTFFTANQTITVEVDIICGYTLTALGMTVTMPDGWEFLQTSGENASEITPKINENTVSFGWINNLYPGELNFTYDLKVSSYAKSDQIIRAKLFYRQGASEELNQSFLPDPILIQADVDNDNDGYPASQDAFPDDPKEWLDTDGDHIGNNADLDDDDDGMPDDWEIEYGFPELKYSANDDPDSDGISNIYEYMNGTPPLNFWPSAPTLLFPVDQETALTPTLKTGPFEDLNETDTHYATDWQLSKQSDFDTLVYDLKTMSTQLDLVIPGFVLDPDTTYYWRVRHYDNYDEPSLWNVASFQTTDLENYVNGVPADQKVSDDTDLDNDGVFDNQQDSIKSLKSIVGDVDVGIRSESPDQYTITMARTVNPSISIAEMYNRPAKLPFGMIAFKIHVDSPGDIAVVTANYSNPLPDKAIWYTYDYQNGWQSFTPQISMDRKIVTLILKDGGMSDADGVANGVIVDPSGPGIPVSNIPDDSPSTPVLVNDPDNGSCFINAVFENKLFK
jgi:hypothetical protein